MQTASGITRLGDRRDLLGVPYVAITPRDQKVLARTRAASTIETMRVHYQQLTEPIARLLDNDLLELFDLDAKFLIPTQLKSLTTRSRRLPPRVIRSPQSTLP